MYLSRIELNRYRSETRKALGSPQIMHASVMSSFPCIKTEEAGRVLWRLDSLGPSMYVLVQSPSKPDFTHMVDQFGWPSSDQRWDTLEYDGFLSKIENGQEWKFRLTANPTRKITDNGKKMVAAHVTAEQQKRWLLDRCVSNGFSIPSIGDDHAFDIVSRRLVDFRREGKTVSIQYTSYEGVLKVEDADLLRKCMLNGIGRAKAYGCGMMTVARRWSAMVPLARRYRSSPA